MQIVVSASDGYSNQKGSIDLSDGWNENDGDTCVDGLAMTAAGLIKALEASGLPIYGGDAVRGFTEGYRDEFIAPADEPAVAEFADHPEPIDRTLPIVPGDAGGTSPAPTRSASRPAV